jgi:hypothetical protein
LRDITQPRMTGSVLKNISMFRELCGTETLPNVVIVTTKWDDVSKVKGEKREEDLMSNYFKGLIELGAKTARHDDTKEAAQGVLRKVLGNSGIPLKIQRELVDERKTLGQTGAGTEIGQDMAKLETQYKEDLEKLKEQIENEHNEKIRTMLEDQQEELAKAQAKMEQDRQTLEASREKQMMEYQKRLEAIAEKANTSQTDVMIKGVSYLFWSAIRFLIT